MGQLLTLMVFGDVITVDNGTDGDEIGATIPGPAGPGIHDPEFCRDQAVGATSGRGRDDESGADGACLLYTSPSPRDGLLSRMPSSA